MSNLALVESLRQRGYLRSKRVGEAMLAVDRAFFVSDSYLPYEDRPFPVGSGQTISAPSVVAFMLDRLEVEPGMKVLEVGTGSGYNAALLSYLVGPEGKVISIEKIPELEEVARKNLEAMGFPENIELRVGDGSCGFEKDAPYDRVIVTAAMPYLDEEHPLVVQLKGDGVLVAPVGNRFSQDIVVFRKKDKSFRRVLPVIFVPLVGEHGFK
ncbi:protein-L-isoaspartate(D-aspartate) O-methyltransferase [Candidatus Micrarchaeota archaeon]|nr:protein-L-isoaspartate(D-aspartate) O-methyltransferase [Candidatus Micrarchaeota archaeon]